ncbi:hypothetical protein [Actinomadura nitritigenes]|uniref:Uncharacterized protein n=1 Tax=Actinomadura nitritigenes TaxID=134602 RepID=A0ABS3RF29_9ACTN|nr:hypothetical protein [Actinomadura nitritigenes]MBO2444836.1 hypothetical protein [Actinomadura nitritigenes]
MGDQMLRLGARIAEIEALYGCALDERDGRAARRLLAELARAGALLAEEADRAARPVRRTAGTRPGRTRLRRRIAGTQRTADRIIAVFSQSRPKGLA